MGKTGFARVAHTLRFLTASSEARRKAKPENWRKTAGFSTNQSADTYISKNGQKAFWDQFSTLAQSASEQFGQIEQTYNNIPIKLSMEYLRKNYPELASQYTYTDSFEDTVRRINGIVPKSFDVKSLLYIPGETAQGDGISGKLFVPEWYELPEVIEEQTFADIQAINSYTGWKFDNPLATELPDDELVQYGASLWAAHEGDTAFQEGFPATTISGADILNEALKDKGREYADANGYVKLTDEMVARKEDYIYQLENQDMSDAYKQQEAWAKETFGDGYDEIPVDFKTTKYVYAGIFMPNEAPVTLKTTFNAATLMLDNPNDESKISEINDKISHATWQIYEGGTVSADLITELRESGLDDIAGILETRSEYNRLISQGSDSKEAQELTGWNGNNYYVLTDGAVEMIRQELYSSAENEQENAENQAAQNTLNEAAWEDIDFSTKVDTVRYGEKTTNWFDDYTLIKGVAEFTLPDKPEKVVTLLKWVESLKDSNDPGKQDLYSKISDELSVITDDNINSLYYYFGEGEKSGDFSKFNEYWDLVKSDYAKAFYQAGKELTRDFTDQDGAGGELFAAAVSVYNSPKAFGAYVETGWDAMTGQEVDTSSPLQLAARATTDYAQISTEDLEGVGKIAADAAIGLIQNAPAIALSIAGLPVVGAAYSAGMTAGTDAAQQNLMGVSAGEALLHSTVMGGIDFLMSVLPFESLSAMAKGGVAKALAAKGLNKILAKALTYTVNFGIQAGLGFGEGMLTSLVSNVADIWVAGENSRYAQLVRQYMKEDGISEKAASAAAIQELCHEALIQSGTGAAIGGASSIIATAVGFKRINEQAQDSINTLVNSDGVSAEKKAILSEMSDDLKNNPIKVVDEAADIINERVQTNPEGVKKALVDGMMALEDIETRMKQESGNINHQGIDISRAYDAYADYFFDGGDLSASAEGIAIGLQEALASGQLTDAEARTLNGVLAELVGDIDSVQGVGDNSVIRTGKGKVVTEIKYKPSSGAELKATPGKTTTILGSFKNDMQYIIDELGNIKSTDFGPKDGGFNVLNTPDDLYKNAKQFWRKYNKPWLDEAIERGDDIMLATIPEDDFLYKYKKSGKKELTGFGREYNYLKEHNYVFDPATNKMVLK